jgi:hypothetical protein
MFTPSIALQYLWWQYKGAGSQGNKLQVAKPSIQFWHSFSSGSVRMDLPPTSGLAVLP